MFAQFVFVFISIILMVGILGLFILKAGLQLQFLRIESKKDKGSITDILMFDFSDKKERAERWQAFLLFPLMYPIVYHEDEAEELVAIKRKVKRINIGIYFVIMVLIVLGVYSQKLFPAN